MSRDHSRRKNSGFILAGILTTLFIGGIAGFVPIVGMKATDNTEFCVSCHTMKHLWEETKLSSHWQNERGVKVGCPDCHLPQDVNEYIFVKIYALKDVFFELIRPAKTKEEYDKIRPRLVQKVREDFLKTDSANCKKCHAYENFTVKIKAHDRVQKEKVTCIECHYNLVHGELPWPEMEEDL